LGGTGFVGRHLTAHLAAQGIQCRIPSRHPQRHKSLKAGTNAEIIAADIFDPKQMDDLLRDCDAVINLVGILNEGGRSNSFKHVHVELADQLVNACKENGIVRLLHMSALNASETGRVSKYLRTKGEAENHVLTRSQGQHSVQVTSFRPSVIFGPDDSFFNRFAALLKQIPGPFPLACPEARFAPVYVGDVVEAFSRALHDRSTWKRQYELCGPRSFSLRELVRYTADQLGKRKIIIPLPDVAARMQAHIFGLLPGKPFSYDNYLSLQIDSVCKEDGLSALGIIPTDISEVVPFYLKERSEKKRFSDLRRQF
jgi:NADH dehydrogenase